MEKNQNQNKSYNVVSTWLDNGQKTIVLTTKSLYTAERYCADYNSRNINSNRQYSIEEA